MERVTESAGSDDGAARAARGLTAAAEGAGTGSGEDPDAAEWVCRQIQDLY